MKVILVDCKYVGGALCFARKMSGLRRRSAAQMLHIPYPEYKKIEQGTAVISEQTLQSILTHGFTLLRAKSGIKK